MAEEASPAAGDGHGSTAYEVDLLIVGAGPAGLYGAYYAGFRGLSAAIMDSLQEPGGQVAALYSEKMIYDVAGFPAIRGRDLVENLVAQAAPFTPTYLLGQRAEHLLQHTDDGLTVTSHHGVTVHCKAMLITGGIGTFTPRPLPDGQAFEGRGLRYFVPRLDDLAGLDTVIVGGGDSAFDWALNLEPLCRSVTLVHRREQFRAHQHTVNQVLASSVRVYTSTEVAGIHGDGAGIRAIELVDKKQDRRWTLPAQSVVAALGFTADLGPIYSWGIANTKRHISVDTMMATNLPRVFAAGDITDYPGKVRLIAVGFGEAATAVNNAATVIDPRLRLFPGHSSDDR